MILHKTDAAILSSKRISNSKGFGLIGVLVVLSIIASLALGAATLTTVLNKDLATYSKKNSILGVEVMTAGALGPEEICAKQSTLIGKKFNGQSEISFGIKFGSSVIGEGKSWQKGSSKITLDLKVLNLKDVSASGLMEDSSHRLYMGSLKLFAENFRARDLGTMFIESLSDGTIVKCFQAPSNARVCRQAGGVMDAAGQCVLQVRTEVITDIVYVD